MCEYVGEILTCTEFYDRNLESNKSGKCTYPVMLDADWGPRALKNEEALCLDATFFGNVARFINHRYLFKHETPVASFYVFICFLVE